MPESEAGARLDVGLVPWLPARSVTRARMPTVPIDKAGDSVSIARPLFMVAVW